MMSSGCAVARRAVLSNPSVYCYYCGDPQFSTKWDWIIHYTLKNVHHQVICSEWAEKWQQYGHCWEKTLHSGKYSCWLSTYHYTTISLACLSANHEATARSQLDFTTLNTHPNLFVYSVQKNSVQMTSCSFKWVFVVFYMCQTFSGPLTLTRSFFFMLS